MSPWAGLLIILAAVGVAAAAFEHGYRLGRRHGREWERMLQRHAHEQVIEAGEDAMARASVGVIEP